jgi:hypothetical protein
MQVSMGIKDFCHFSSFCPLSFSAWILGVTASLHHTKQSQIDMFASQHTGGCFSAGFYEK